MSDETPTEVNPIEQLRNEFAEQFNSLKTSFESSIKEKDDLIEQLQSHNKELERALIRSAVHDPPAPQKSEQDIYNDKVKALADKTLSYMKQR